MRNHPPSAGAKAPGEVGGTLQAGCLQSFPDAEPRRVIAAYVWVQQLVDVPDVPLHLDDALFTGLGISQPAIESKLAAAHVTSNQAVDGGHALRQSLRTVRDLMAALLAAGY